MLSYWARRLRQLLFDAGGGYVYNSVMNKTQCRIAYYVFLFASALVSYISIETSMDAMSAKQPPNVPLHLFEFALAIALVCVALYFQYKAYRDDAKK